MDGLVLIREKPLRDAAIALLAAEKLPCSDLGTEHFEHFFYAGAADAPIALIGQELCRPDALLRSLVVREQARAQGLGSMLVAHAEQYASALQLSAIYLLTTTAVAFFEHRGYRHVARSLAPQRIQSTAEFAGLCPASSAFMKKQL
jgi:amino-acid N-acetyltransferase